MTWPIPQALQTADDLAAELADPHSVRPSPAAGRAWPQSLAGGATGIALLHVERARSSHGDEATARAWLAAAFAAPVTAAANANLYVGAPALAFVTHAATATTSRAERTLAVLDEAILRLTRLRLAQAHERIDRGDRPQLHEFDLIRGLTGLGVYHLRRHPDHEVTRDVLAYLVRLTQPLTSGDDLPAWWTPVAPNGEHDPAFPGGHGNFGVSHGVSAVLALLALAQLRDLLAPGLEEAIGRICAWTDRWRQTDLVGPWWPGFISLDQVRDEQAASARPRPSWCYGIAGTARAQQLAALAINDPSRQRTAEQAMLSTLRDPALAGRLPETGLCHGLAGLLQAAWRMATDALDDQIAVELPALAVQLATRLPSADPELLDGAAGVALALHTLGTGTAPASGWDAAFLLAA